MRKLASISVDLTGLPLLCQRYGVDERTLPPAGTSAVALRAPERYAELLDRRGAAATFFAIVDDLEDREAGAAIASLAKLGHEIGTLDPSLGGELALLPSHELATWLEQSGAAIARCIGHLPTGFRSLGRILRPSLLEGLEAAGYLYDASLLPGPLHLALDPLPTPAGERGIVDRHGALLAPREPYRPSPRDPYRRGSAKLLELPVTTSFYSRIPLTGGVVTTLPKSALAVLYRSLRRRSFLSIQLQGVDLLDESDGISLELLRRRRPLRSAAAVKRQRIVELLDWLRDDFELVTLEEAATRLAPELP